MQVLSVASEIFPLIKTGGLADVAGALPPALAGQNVAVRSLIPGYPAVMGRLEETEVAVDELRLLGAPARLLSARVGDLDLIVMDAPTLFDRPGGPYSDTAGRDHADNWRRFGALARAGALVADGLIPGYRPDLVHAHDWQAALTAAYLKYGGINLPSVVTIHNMAFQGHFPASIFQNLELPPQAFSIYGVEYFGGVGYLKAGLECAWAVTTVSPTYAQEIATPAYGMGLDGLIAGRAGSMHGIVNGIDTGVWNPETDANLPQTFNARRLKDRAVNRAALESRFGLSDAPGPLFTVISRLTWQKGLDLLADATPALVAAGGKLAVLGSGEPELETRFLGLASQYPGRVGVLIGYDEPLSHLAQGGGDAILIPSRFEPCGLTQLYGLRYGCVPVVARTGGLADTVVDANVAALNAGVATGLLHAPADPGALALAIRRAADLYRIPKTWSALQRQGMKSDVSWDRSAATYAQLFESLVA